MKNKIRLVWKSFNRRCYNKLDNAYSRYGERGITVCNEWKNDFKTFYDWAISNGWNEGLYIDRINNDGNYEPINCRFVSSAESAQNRSRNTLTKEKVLEIRKYYKVNESLTNSKMAKIFKIKRPTMYDVLNNITWKNIS
jgi:hypothetical protein